MNNYDRCDRYPDEISEYEFEEVLKIPIGTLPAERIRGD